MLPNTIFIYMSNQAWELTTHTFLNKKRYPIYGLHIYHSHAEQSKHRRM